MRFSSGLLLLTLFTACSSVEDPVKQAAVDEQFLQGTWLVLNNPTEKEVFLPSRDYCAYETSKNSGAVTVGTWSISQPGYVYFKISNSIYPNQMSADGASEFRIVERIASDKLLMGYICSHCDGGIAGHVYVRAKVQINACDQLIKP